MKTFDVTYHFAGGRSLETSMDAENVLEARDKAVAMGMHHPYQGNTGVDTGRGVATLDDSEAYHINMAQVTHISVLDQSAKDPIPVYKMDPATGRLADRPFATRAPESAPRIA